MGKNSLVSSAERRKTWVWQCPPGRLGTFPSTSVIVSPGGLHRQRESDEDPDTGLGASFVVFVGANERRTVDGGKVTRSSGRCSAHLPELTTVSGQPSCVRDVAGGVQSHLLKM